MTEWATINAMVVSDVVSEVGPEMNGRRRKLSRLLIPRQPRSLSSTETRLVSFGVEHLEAALSVKGRRIVVEDDAEADNYQDRE